MAPPKRNRRRANRSRRATASFRSVRLVNRTVIGMPLKPSADPPKYTTAPWASVLLPITVSDAKTLAVTPAYVYSEFLNFMNWDKFTKPDPNDASKTVQLPLEFRIETVRVWGGKDGSLVSLVIYDTVSKQHKLAELSDFGAPVTFSRVGWKFGAITRSNAFRPSDPDMLFEVNSPRQVLIYIQLLFRTYDADPVSTNPALSAFLDSSRSTSENGFDVIGMQHMHIQ